MEKKGRKLYTRRWFFLIGIALFQLSVGLSFASFGQISNFYSQFFDVDYSVVDWFMNGRNISSIFFTIPLAWLIFKGKVRLRLMVLMMAATSTFGMLLVTAALTHPNLMALIFVGQALLGLGKIISICLPSSFAILWFPECQVGTAIALNFIGMSCGEIVATVLTPSLLYFTGNDTNAYSYNLSQVTLQNGQRALQWMYGVASIIPAFLGLLFYIFITDRPPTAPTIAQEIRSRNIQSKRTTNMFIQESKSLFANWSYSAMTIVFGLCFQFAVLEILMMSEILHNLDLHRFSYLPSDVVSGIVMSLWFTSNVLGLTVCGKLVDYCKRYKSLMIASLLLDLFATVALTLSIYTSTPIAILLTNCLFGFFNGLTYVISMELITQLTYPVDETLVNAWATGITYVISMLLCVFGRIIFTKYGGVGVLVFQSALLVACTFVTCFISPENKRLSAEQDVLPSTDTTPLVQN